MGLILDLHGWRAFAWERDLLHWKITAAFLTVMVCRFCVLDRLEEISKALAEARAALERRSPPEGR